MRHLDQVNLTSLMELTDGRPEVVVGLIDGPVDLSHSALSDVHVREIPGRSGGACIDTSSVACLHGTFVAGILFAKRGADAPAVCPGCTLLACPIFAETEGVAGEMPGVKPQELSQAILACIDAGARVLNVSAAIAQPSPNSEAALEEALDYAVRRGVIVVAAAGNQGTLGSTAITRHPWVIPVTACDERGWPTADSNLGSSISRRGLAAPGDRVTSLGVDGETLTLGGTSAAVPFVTGAIALLGSLFPAASAAAVRSAVTRASARRNTVVPPLLDAWGAYQTVAKTLYSATNIR
jgi:subtilisin family serine protease